MSEQREPQTAEEWKGAYFAVMSRLTRERIAVMIYDRLPHEAPWSFDGTGLRGKCLDIASAILALVDPASGG